MKLPFHFMSAAGWAKTPAQVQTLAEVPYLTHIVAGSFTPEAREGNTGGTNFAVAPDGTSVNSLGLPNKGAQWLHKHGPEMAEIAHAAGKEFVLSIAGFSPRDYGTLALVAAECGADHVEVNVGCPNVRDGDGHQEIIAYNFLLLEKTLDAVREAARVSLWLKVSPYANPTDRIRLAEMLKRRPVETLVAANTFPQVSMYGEGEKPLLHVADNYAGMAGTSLKWINLSQCRHYHKLLPGLPVIGVGGVGDGTDVTNYLNVGCSGVQIGTTFFKSEDPAVFEHIVWGLPERILPFGEEALHTEKHRAPP